MKGISSAEGHRTGEKVPGENTQKTWEDRRVWRRPEMQGRAQEGAKVARATARLPSSTENIYIF